MLSKYLIFSISISVISWLVGMVLNFLLRQSASYTKAVSNLNFIRSKKINRMIGIGLFKWIVKNTFFKYLNPKLTLSAKTEKEDLLKLRSEMTISEVDHLIGFAFVSFFAAAKILNGLYLFAVIITFINTLLNLYPSILQQENKRRIDLLLKRMTGSPKS